MSIDVETPFGVDAWVNYLCNKPLSVRNSIQIRLHKLLASDSTTLADLSKLLKLDPVLAFCIVRKASELHTTKGSEVTGLDHAVNSLGMDNIKEAMAAVPALKLNPTSVAQKMYFRAIANSHHAATQARFITESRHLQFAEETYLASLFYGIAHWCLWLHAPLHMSAIQVKIREQGIDNIIAENDVLGCSTQQLSLALVKYWGLSKLAEESLEHDTSPDHDDLKLLSLRNGNDDRLSPEESRQINHLVQQKFFPVKISNWLALTAPLGWNHSKTLRIVEIFNDYMRGEVDSTAAKLHTQCAKSARTYHVPGTLTPAAEMLFLPSRRIAHYKIGQREADQLSITAPPVPEQPKIEALDNPVNTLAEASFADQKIYVQTAQRFLKGHAEYKSAKHILQALIQGLNKGLGMKRVCFFRTDTKSQQLSLASALGLPKDFNTANLKYTLDSPTLFKKLAQKPACIMISDNNRSDMMKMLPTAFQAMIPASGALLMSIFIGEKVIGIIQVDTPHNEVGLQTFHHERFRYLCLAANSALKKLK